MKGKVIYNYFSNFYQKSFTDFNSRSTVHKTDA